VLLIPYTYSILLRRLVGVRVTHAAIIILAVDMVFIQGPGPRARVPTVMTEGTRALKVNIHSFTELHCAFSRCSVTKFYCIQYFYRIRPPISFSNSNRSQITADAAAADDDDDVSTENIVMQSPYLCSTSMRRMTVILDRTSSLNALKIISI